MQRTIFHDRHEAGRELAERLRSLRGQADVVVLALPRGGVPVAYEIATFLQAPVEVFVVRKLGVPGHEELAMGAVASGSVRVLNDDVVEHLGIPPRVIEQVTDTERRELDRRDREYREGREFPNLAGATVVLVDDGVATGATMAAGVEAVRQFRPAQVVVAVPVISQDAMRTLANVADRLECLAAPEFLDGVGAWYEDFAQTSDETVRSLLSAARSARNPARTSAKAPGLGHTVSKGIRIPVNGTWLHGDLVIPGHATALVVFAHGSGSSRFSPRNQQVASALNEASYATLLFDLLTSAEEAFDRATGELRFDIGFLARRLAAVTDWLAKQEEAAAFRVGYFGASTGAAAALVAAAARPHHVHAIVSRGGRPDLAGDTLPHVRAPTLLIVGSHDPQVLSFNRAARVHMRSAETELAVVPNARHLFEEPGAMEEVARLATAWFDQHLAGHLATSA